LGQTDDFTGLTGLRFTDALTVLTIAAFFPMESPGIVKMAGNILWQCPERRA